MSLAASATPEETAAWLKLTKTSGLHETAVRSLLAEFGLPATILAQGVNALARVVGHEAALKLKTAPDSDQDAVTLATRAWLAREQRYVLTIADPGYPKQLLEAPAAPFMLFANGRLDGLALPRVALVAPQDATGGAIETGAAFASALAARGVALAVEFGSPFSKAVIEAVLPVKGADLVAVLTDGPHQITPAAQVDLARQVAIAHTLISALAPGEVLSADERRQPNALLIGLCVAILVIEAPLRSRPLATARLAGEAGRDVMAVPGSIHSPLARGCHRLIREGARLVDSIDDVVEEIQRFATKQAPTAR